MSEDLIKITDAMSTYGGSFVKSLAECCRRADHVNRAKLILTFGEYFRQYAEMAGVKI